MERSSRIGALYDAYLRKRPRQARSRSVVEAILTAALERLSSGNDEASLGVHDVAARAGVGVGSLYDYFHDRKGLLGALAAKITEDNLRAFEALLERVEHEPLRVAVEAIIDFALETYTTDTRLPRAVLRIAHAAGLMPTLAESQRVFSRSLARALGRRADVRVPDVEHAAFIATNGLMGVVHALVWEDEPVIRRDALRSELVRLFETYLAGA